MANEIPPTMMQAREQFLAMVAGVRPELHRYVPYIATEATVEGSMSSGASWSARCR